VHGQFLQPSERLLIAFPISLLILIFQKKNISYSQVSV
jgi:hypothetical protein